MRQRMKLQQLRGKILARDLLCFWLMSVYSPEYHAMVHSPSPAAQNVASAAAQNTATTAVNSGNQSGNQSANQSGGFFHHLLDVINPLQHLPVIGTIYRAITGEHIGAVERIAGDTLYCGLWGAVSSIADVAFEGITGKSAEDTVLAWFKSDSPTQVAVTAPTITPNISGAQSLPSTATPSLPPSSSTEVASAQPASSSNTLSNALSNSVSNGPDVQGLSAALSARGITGDMAARALAAYRRAIAPQPAPVFATIN